MSRDPPPPLAMSTNLGGGPTLGAKFAILSRGQQQVMSLNIDADQVDKPSRWTRGGYVLGTTSYGIKGKYILQATVLSAVGLSRRACHKPSVLGRGRHRPVQLPPNPYEHRLVWSFFKGQHIHFKSFKKFLPWEFLKRFGST